MDEQAYLEPGFDPSSLTIPRLRSILVAHNVNYPSSAKKGQLIDLFNDHVLPQARKLRNANARVKRTSRGIENVPATQSSVDEDELEEELQAPPSAATRSSRRSTRARTEEAEDVIAPTPRGTRGSTAPPDHLSRRVSGRSVRKYEGDDAGHDAKRPASRRSRVSAAVTPSAREQRGRDDESPFSNENVFQSGGSPPPPTNRDTERRRTTMTTNRDAERRRSREVRRRTEEVRPHGDPMDGAVVPTRRTFDMPAAESRRAEVEPTEEFTPDEQEDLVVAEQSGELVPTRPRQRQRPSHAAKNAPWAISVVFLAGLAAFFRQEKLEVGYCGVGSPSIELAGVAIPDWADVLRPQCELCPAHSFCGEHLETTCEPGFVLVPHPFSLAGAVLLPPSCEPDSAKAKKVSAVKDRAVEELRERNAKFECGEAPQAEVKETELKQAIGTKRRKGMSNEEFEDLWSSALGEIQGVEEIVSGTDGHTGTSTLRSTSLARVPFTCAVQRSLRQSLRQNFWQLVGIILTLSAGGYARYTITSGRATEREAKRLASLALEKLSRQASLHAYDPVGYGENYVSVAQLRDDVLREEFSARRRTKLWERVRAKVENNSNVRPMVREGRSGDVGRVWEWVGAVGLLEGSPMNGNAGGVERWNRGGGGGRISFGGGAQERLAEPRDGDVSVVRKWEEGGRPYY